MYECKLKMFFLSFAVFLFLATTTFGWDGPCISLFTACGGHAYGETTCGPHPEGDPCRGSCSSTCATGGSNEGCSEILGDCTATRVPCSPIYERFCTLTPGGCVCEPYLGPTGNCMRIDC